MRDDVPVLVKHKTEFVKVDEDDIQNSQSVGTSPDDGNADGSYTGAANVNDGGAATVDRLAGVSRALGRRRQR